MDWSWEQRTLINELIQGMEMAKQLRVHFSTRGSPEMSEMLVKKLLSSYEKALLILNWGGSVSEVQTQNVAATAVESPISINGSPLSQEFEQKNVSKKRKTTPRWMDQVKVSCDTGLEGPFDDGYSWRKYGQKDILGAKYPRSYYRCTYRNTRSCWAVKQVQRSDEDPSIFDITYRGTHNCTNSKQCIQTPSSPQKQDKENHNNDSHHLQKSQQILFNFRTNLKVNTEESENKEMASSTSFPSMSLGCGSEKYSFLPSTPENNNQIANYSPSFLTPSTSESNYFLSSPRQMNNFGGAYNMHHSISDPSGMKSANTSATNSPIVNLDFSLDRVDIDPYFPFDTPGFFS